MDHVAEFIASKDQFPLSTRKTYRNALRAFGLFMAEVEKDALGFPADIMVRYRHWLSKPYVNRAGETVTRRPRTITLYTGSALRFLRWLSTSGHIERTAYLDIADYTKDNISLPRDSYVARPIDPAIGKLITHYVNIPLPEKGPERLRLLRNRALVIFLYDSACRISEALALTRADVIDGKATKILLRVTKGHKVRTVMITEETRQYLQAYIAERHDTSSAPLFLSHGRGKGKALSTHRAWEIVDQAAEAEKLMDSTSPHCLRHKRAQDLLDAGMPLEWIARYLGHAHTDTAGLIYAPWVHTGKMGEMLDLYGMTPLEAARQASGEE